MANISINFLNPTDGREINVTVEDSITGQEVIAELIANDFIPVPSETLYGYKLSIKGSGDVCLENNKTFADEGVKDNDTIRVMPAFFYAGSNLYELNSNIYKQFNIF